MSYDYDGEGTLKIYYSTDDFTDVVDSSDSLYSNPEFYGIAVNKSNKALAERLNSGLEKIAASGELKAIHEKWFGVAD